MRRTTPSEPAMPCNATPILESLESMASETHDATILGLHVVRAIEGALPQASWVGIYWREGNDLVLGPYIGAPTVHTRISAGQGVCGMALRDEADQLIEDVRDVDHYLACSPSVRSELVVLIRSCGEIVGQIDLDSDQIAGFDADDACVLRAVADCFGGLIDVASIVREPLHADESAAVND